MEKVKELPVKEKSSLWLTEDWSSVFIGALVILAVLTWLDVDWPKYDWNSLSNLGTAVNVDFLQKLCIQFFWILGFSVLAVWLMGKFTYKFILTFFFVFVLTQVALFLGGNSLAREFNFEAVIFSLTLGLVVGNFFKLPNWIRENLTTELFVKIGLVLLGASVIFSDILKAGSLGLIQALIVVLSVWYFAFWLCKRLKVDEEMTMMISSAVSICGVSAAIATAGAIKGDPKKLSYVISLVLIVAIPMMLLMPPLAQWMGLSQSVTGAWLGGSIDTSGAVVASGSLVGEEALKVSTIVKFSQNVLLGLAAFAISVYWTYTNNPSSKDKDKKPTLKVIWERFPKFVIGFIGASLLFSFFIKENVYHEVKGDLKNFQNLWFALSFTCIGLETKFSDLINGENQKPLWAFLIAQFFNVLVTLIIAYLLFS